MLERGEWYLYQGPSDEKQVKVRYQGTVKGEKIFITEDYKIMLNCSSYHLDKIQMSLEDLPDGCYFEFFGEKYQKLEGTAVIKISDIKVLDGRLRVERTAR